MSSALDLPLEECVELLTEGGNDAGVDGLHIGEIEDLEFFVTLFQGKYRVKDLEGQSNFPENSVQKVVDTVGVLFDPYRAVVLNERIEPLVEEIRSLIRDGYIPTVRVVLCNNGARWTAQADAWIHDANQSYGEKVEFLHFNHDAIVNSLKRGDRIDANVALSGQAIVEDMNYMRVLVGRVPVGEIARLFAEHGDQLLQRNIRRYLGHVNRVNSDIRATLLDPERSDKFYFYNNGITVVCDRFDYNALQRGDYQVRLSNMQVINGGQTCKTIQQTLSVDGAPDVEDAYVMLRIYQLPDEAADVVQEITKATNSQNPVDLRDLRSNDEWQRTLELGMRELGFEFKRHRAEGGVGPGVVTSATVAEAVLAIWRERPHQAKFRRREHFGKLYETIFKDLIAAQAVMATLIYRMVEGKRREGGDDPPDFLPYASHHIAMLLGRELSRELQLSVEAITHRSFARMKAALDTDGARYYALAIDSLRDAIRECYGNRQVSLQQLAATFRRGDLLEMLDANDPVPD